MPTALVGSNAFTAPVNAPNDTEAANAASVRGALQAVTDRSVWAQTRIGANSVIGVNKIQGGTAATMSAVNDAFDGDFFALKDPTVFGGLFVYRASSVKTVDSRLVYAATGMASVGRWEHSMIDLLGLAGGVEFCRSHQKNSSLANLTTNSTSETTLASIGMGTLVAGDVVTAYWQALVSCVASFNLDVYVSENGGGDVIKTIVNAYEATPGAGTHVSAGVGFTHVVGTGGTFSIKIKGRTTNGANQLSVWLLPYIIKAVKP